MIEYKDSDTKKDGLIIAEEDQDRNDKYFDTLLTEFLNPECETSDLISLLREMNAVLIKSSKKNEHIDLSILFNIIDIYDIFYNFLTNCKEHKKYVIDLVSSFIKLIFYLKGRSVAENFSKKSILINFFAENLTTSVLELFAIMIGESQTVHDNLVVSIDLNTIEKIENNDPEFKRAKFLLYANYCIFCDLENEFTKKVFNICTDTLYDEKDDECYVYKIHVIENLIERSEMIYNFLLEKKDKTNTEKSFIIKLIKTTLENEKNNKRIQLCLRMLQILLEKTIEMYREKLANETPMHLLLEKLSNEMPLFSEKIDLNLFKQQLPNGISFPDFYQEMSSNKQDFAENIQEFSNKLLELLNQMPLFLLLQKLSKEMPLPLLLQELSKEMPSLLELLFTFNVENGIEVLNCVKCLLNFKDVYSFEYYTNAEFPLFISSTFEKRCSFDMKETALMCIYSFLLLFDCPISEVFNDEMLSDIYTFFDGTFNSQNYFFYNVCYIIQCIINEQKLILTINGKEEDYSTQINLFFISAKEETNNKTILNFIQQFMELPCFADINKE